MTDTIPTLAQAREVLREAEWVFIGTRTVCPACGESVYAGHAPDCKLNAALAAKGE
ncbi:MAG: hypothetical protein L6Q74_05130 [Sphaerotilus natans subsp. sulfidivorans]|uniref:hypothetical protein n=1 Tax=Sphaerotilus sulfidivorans TaxID=639200 RepID=UPI002353CE51|nr:hypothetical protein [Sphaerotilus sulfidivorans]MCK6401282.1 hypothetical protein [Sphaerotilus sulfidivorans]